MPEPTLFARRSRGGSRAERIGAWLSRLAPGVARELAGLLTGAAPNGVIADWLEEHGQPRSWANGVRVQGVQDG